MPLPRFVDYSLRFLAPISLGLAVYYHYQSVQERDPTYSISPSRARIVDTSVPAPAQLQVLYKGKELNSNVTAVTVYLWNSGRLPIKAEDVLEPIRIDLDPASEILEARILSVSRLVTKFAKGEVSETAKNSLPLSFSILEHGDGAVLQLIYTGKPDERVTLLGTIVGAGKPREIPGAAVQETGKRPSLIFYGFIFCIFASMSATLFQVARGPGQRLTPFGRLLTVVSPLVALLMVAFIIYDYHRVYEPVIPPSISTIRP